MSTEYCQAAIVILKDKIPNIQVCTVHVMVEVKLYTYIVTRRKYPMHIL